MFPGFWTQWMRAYNRAFADREPEARCYQPDDTEVRTDGGEIIDGETGDTIEAHEDYPNVNSPEWPGREIDLKPLTNVTVMWDPELGEDSAIVVETPDIVRMDLEDER